MMTSSLVQEFLHIMILVNHFIHSFIFQQMILIFHAIHQFHLYPNSRTCEVQEMQKFLISEHQLTVFILILYLNQNIFNSLVISMISYNINDSKNLRHLNKFHENKSPQYQNQNERKLCQQSNKKYLLISNSQNMRNKSSTSFQSGECKQRKYSTKKYIKNNQSQNEFTSIQDKEAFTQQISSKSLENSHVGNYRNRKSIDNKSRRDENNIQISQFTIEQQYHQQDNNKQNHQTTSLQQDCQQPTSTQNNQLLTNITRIIDCKNTTTSLLSQVQIYLKTISKLKKQNTNYQIKLQLKEKQNKQLRDLVHIKDMEIMEVCEDNQRIRRMYLLQSAKLKVIRQSYVEADGVKLQAVIRESSDNSYDNCGYYDEEMQNNINLDYNFPQNSLETEHKGIKHQQKMISSKKQYKNTPNNTTNLSPFYQIYCKNSNEYLNPQIQHKKAQPQTNNQSQSYLNEKQNTNINVSKLLEKNNQKVSGKIVKRWMRNREWEDQSTLI